MTAVTTETLRADDVAPGRTDRNARRHRRRRLVLGGVALVLLVSAIGVVVDESFGGNGDPDVAGEVKISLATVEQRDLSSQVNESGTLGYAGSYTVSSKMQGTLTALPSVGQVIEQGQMLFEVDDDPVVLLYGAKPAYRSLGVGDTGPDVAQLNAALVALGYATVDQLDPTSERFGSATAAALERFQGDLGVEQTGRLELGQALFFPSALRVTTVNASLGSNAGEAIFTASSTTRIVTVNLNANRQSQIEVGDQVTITLPDGTQSPGVVYAVGKVATTSGDDTTPTVPVVIVPTDPGTTGDLDQAPVTVSIVTETVKDAFVVPVHALLALAGGGYAIETVDKGGARRLVPVELGLFDDADGLVQIKGEDVMAGQRVVVPAA